MVTYEYHVLHCSGNIFKPFFPNVSTIFRILKHVYSENKINSAHETRTYACILEGKKFILAVDFYSSKNLRNGFKILNLT